VKADSLNYAEMIMMATTYQPQIRKREIKIKCPKNDVYTVYKNRKPTWVH
jgi:hypothetical protein